MAVTNTPIFTQTPQLGYNVVATQDTALDSPSTHQVTVFTAGANGSKVFEITVQGEQASIAAGMVRIFVGASATTGHLVDEFTVVATSGSNTVPMFRITKQYDNFMVPANQLVIATTSITQNLNVLAWYADF